MKRLVLVTSLVMFAATSGFAQDAAGMDPADIQMSVQQQGAEMVPHGPFDHPLYCRADQWRRRRGQRISIVVQPGIPHAKRKKRAPFAEPF